MLKKILHKAHLWMGLSSGFIVFILGISGCILVFVNEIKPIVYKDHYFVDAKDTLESRLSFTHLLNTAENHWGTEKPVSSVEIENNAQRTWHFRAYKEDDNTGIWYWNEKKYYESLFVNPYTGAQVLSENGEYEFFRIMLYLHWSLLLKTEIGQPIIGTATLIFVILLLTGLYLWWPKNKKAQRVRFWFRWKKKTGNKRKNYDLHNILGFYSISIALILGLTGLIWAFSWFDQSVKWLLNNAGSSPKQEQMMPTKNLYAPDFKIDTTLAIYDQILLKIQQENPDALAYNFYLPREKGMPLNVNVIYGKTYTSFLQQYNVQDGTLLNTIDFSSKDNGEKMRDLNYDLHLGTILGIPGKIIVFLASLISASLPITGFYIWYNRRRKGKKENRKQKLPSI